MGKKGKVNKLAKMSDEERARYLQHRADLEEEARRRKQELIHRFIKVIFNFIVFTLLYSLHYTRYPILVE